jgi:hypothetical protein
MELNLICGQMRRGYDHCERRRARVQQMIDLFDQIAPAAAFGQPRMMSDLQ